MYHRIKIAVVKIQRHTENRGVKHSFNSSNQSQTKCTTISQPFICYLLGRVVGVGPIRRPGDRKIDTSPYSSGNTAYLSPPSDSNWRRTSSDSAIHQSLIQQNQVS